jgi:hypothetical protein
MLSINNLGLCGNDLAGHSARYIWPGTSNSIPNPLQTGG